MLSLLLLIVVKGYAETPIFSDQLAVAIKGIYLEEFWFEIGALIIVRELDFSFIETSLSMKPFG